MNTPKRSSLFWMELCQAPTHQPNNMHAWIPEDLIADCSYCSVDRLGIRRAIREGDCIVGKQKNDKCPGLIDGTLHHGLKSLAFYYCCSCPCISTWMVWLEKSAGIVRWQMEQYHVCTTVDRNITFGLSVKSTSNWCYISVHQYGRECSDCLDSNINIKRLYSYGQSSSPLLILIPVWS